MKQLYITPVVTYTTIVDTNDSEALFNCLSNLIGSVEEAEITLNHTNLDQLRYVRDFITGHDPDDKFCSALYQIITMLEKQGEVVISCRTRI